MKTYTTRGLPDGSSSGKEFVFLIEDASSPPTLRIPGEQRGPDVCIPDNPEQARWLDSRDDLLTPSWDCEWRFVSAETAQQFIRLIS